MNFRSIVGHNSKKYLKLNGIKIKDIALFVLQYYKRCIMRLNQNLQAFDAIV